MSERIPKLPRPDRTDPFHQRLRYFRLSGAWGDMVRSTRLLRQDPMEIVDYDEKIREGIVNLREIAIHRYTDALELAMYFDFNIPKLLKKVQEEAEGTELIVVQNGKMDR